MKLVDYGSDIGWFGGRYCEKGVDESTKESNTRTGLMFYELNTFDPLGDTPFNRTTDSELQGTFMGDLNVYAQITRLMDPESRFRAPSVDAGEQPTPDQGQVAVAASSQEAAENDDPNLRKREIPNVMPDG